MATVELLKKFIMTFYKFGKNLRIQFKENIHPERSITFMMKHPSTRSYNFSGYHLILFLCDNNIHTHKDVLSFRLFG